MSTSVTAAQPWVDPQEYPFTSNFFETESGKIHYVDEGEGEVLLFVHGTPTWSFLYRDLIKNLSKTHRCIAIDHLGFGLSDKPTDFQGRPEDHAANLKDLIEHLDLKHINLVVHDFGGPIGLSYAVNHPENIKRVVLFNSWLWETKDDAQVVKIDKLINSWMGKMLYLNFNFSPKVLLKQGFYDKKKLTKDIHQQYIKPFPGKDTRYGLLRVGKSLMGSSDWYASLWSKVDLLKNIPFLIIWGTNDTFFKAKDLDKWSDKLAQAEVHQLEAGHFVMEEQREPCLKLIKEFLNNSNQTISQ